MNAKEDSMHVYTQVLPNGTTKAIVYPPQMCPACQMMRSLFTNAGGVSRCYLCAEEDTCRHELTS